MDIICGTAEFPEPLKQDAQEGGAVAGSTRRYIEKRSGKTVVTRENFMGLIGKGREKVGE